jgi:enoyl-CoA hydratase
MLFESRHIQVTADHGTATLAFGFGGEPVNALDLARLRELDAAIRTVADSPFVRILVLRSANPTGFCGGLHPSLGASLVDPAERASFAWYGQQVCDRLSQLDAASVALIDGPCLGVGLELALACDHRLCVARPTTHLGFPDRFTCFGGKTRLRQLLGRRAKEFLSSGRKLSGREARELGLVEVACCERRSKIELRSFLDGLEQSPRKAPRMRALIGLALERREFAKILIQQQADLPRATPTTNPIPPFPEMIGLLGNDPQLDQLAAEVALRGGSVVLCGKRSGVFARIAEAQKRGFVTPLEAEQAQVRVQASDTLVGFERAGLVFIADGQNAFRLAAAVRPRTVVCVVRRAGNEPIAPPQSLAVPFPFARRVLSMSFCDTDRAALFPDAATDPDIIAALCSWLRPFRFTPVVFPIAARLLPRAA